jgi:hypothetical protein
VSALSFTLLLRLADGYRPALCGPEAWIDWRHAASLVPQSPYGEPGDEPPYKRYPADRQYFAPQVREVLFPTRHVPEDCGRWLRRPVGSAILLGSGTEAELELSIDLLEIVRVRITPHIAFGIAHVSVTGEPTPEQMLTCARVLSTRYRPSEREEPYFATAAGSTLSVLGGTAPLSSLTAELFGSAHDTVALRAYLFCAVQMPIEQGDEQRAAWRRALRWAAQRRTEQGDEQRAAWRRALAQGYALERAQETIARDPERDKRRTERLGPHELTLFGRSAAVTYREEPPSVLRNVRSYWAESVLYALIQHAHIEHYTQRLSELGGAPLSKPVDELFTQWLAFRNVLWWHHASFTTDVPNRLLRQAHRGLETDALYAELEGSFSTYVDARRHRSEDVEAGALRALQVYGAGFAIVGTAGAVMQVAGEQYLDTTTERAVAIAGLLILGVLTVLAAWLWLSHRDRQAERAG